MDKTISRQIINMVFDSSPEIMTREEAKTYVNYLLTLMTKKQRAEMEKKVRRCNYYIDAIKNKGMDKARVRSILKRKEGLSRQNMPDVCKPCEEIMHGNNI